MNLSKEHHERDSKLTPMTNSNPVPVGLLGVTPVILTRTPSTGAVIPAENASCAAPPTTAAAAAAAAELAAEPIDAEVGNRVTLFKTAQSSLSAADMQTTSFALKLELDDVTGIAVLK